MLCSSKITDDEQAAIRILPRVGNLKKYYVYVFDTEETILDEGIDSISLSRKEYSGLLYLLSSHQVLGAVLNNQNFRCDSCRCFSLPAVALCSALEKITTDDEVTEMILSALWSTTEIDQRVIDLLDQPEEIIKKIFTSPDEYNEIKKAISDDRFCIKEGEIYRFPFEECVFVFNRACSCSRILHA